MTGALICEECGRLAAPGARGWKGYLAGLNEDDECDEGGVEVLIFCPRCAEREFGIRRRST